MLITRAVHFSIKPVSGLGLNSLSRFVQVLLEVGHERSASSAHGRGVGCAGLVLAEDVAVGVADMDLAELGQ